MAQGRMFTERDILRGDERHSDLFERFWILREALMPGRTPPHLQNVMLNVREIAARQGIPDNIRLTSWKNAYNMALLYPKVLLFSTERTPERESLFQWVGPVGKNDAILYARKGSGIRISSLDEARNVAAIATTTNWFTEQQLKREGFTNLLSSPEPRANVRQLMNGEVQLSVFTDITIPEITREAGYSMTDLEPVFTVGRTYFYIALSHDTPAEVVAAWQSALLATRNRIK